MKKIFAVIAFSALSTLGIAQDTVRMTLDSCLNYAYSHNITVRNAELNKVAATEALLGAKMRFLPMISASASESWGFDDGPTMRNGNYGVSGNLTLFDGLSNLRNYQQRKLAEEQSDLQIEQSRNAISSQIVSAYLTIVMNREKLRFQEKVLETSKKQAEEGALKLQVGKILESDYLLLEANYQRALNEIENSRITIETNQLELKSLLCVTDVVDVAETAMEDKEHNYALPPLDTVVAKSLAHLPDLSISEMDVKIAEYNVKLAQSAYMPSLGLNAGLNYYEGQSGQVDGAGTVITNGGMNSNIMLSLSVPILNRGVTRTQVKQSKINLQQVQLQHNQKALDLRKEIESQYRSTQQALNGYKSAKLMESAYKASYDVYVLKYAEGIVTTVEMLQQQDKYLNALSDYLQSKYTFILDEKVLKIYMGES